MGLTKETLAERLGGVTATDIGKIAGVHPKETATSVFLEKRELILPDDGPEPEFLGMALRHERTLSEIYTERTGIKLRGDGTVTVRHPERQWQRCTIDRETCPGRGRKPWIVELKTAFPWSAPLWGPALSDRVPDHHLCQVAWQMSTKNRDRADIAVMLGLFEVRFYTIERDRELEEMLIELGHDFHFNHALTGEPPVAVRNEDVARRLKALYPRETKPARRATEYEERLADDLFNVREVAKRVGAEKEAIELQIKETIADAAGLVGDGWEISYRANRDTLWIDHAGVVADLQAAGVVPAELIARHTHTRRGARVLRPKLSKTEENTHDE